MFFQSMTPLLYNSIYCFSTGLPVAIITDANSTFMRDYVDYFPDVFDAFNVIQVGDVDPEGKLDAAAKELHRVDSLDDLADFVEAAKEIIESEHVFCLIYVMQIWSLNRQFC